MPRRHKNARDGGNDHSRSGAGWMKGKRKKGQKNDRAPLTPGSMHSRTRIR